MKKKLLAIMLTALLIVSMLPVAALAAEPCPDGSHTWNDGVCGTCGEVCAHSNGYYAGACKICGVACTHSNGYSGGGYSKAGQCNTCKLNCTHAGPQTIVVTNCNNNAGKKYGKTTCACGYFTQGVLGDGVPHTGGPNCTVCGQVNSDYVPECTNHTFDQTGHCTTPGCTATCAHGTTQTIYTCQGTYETVRCSGCGYVISTTDKGGYGPHSYGDDGKCIHCGNPEPCTTHTWDKTERTGNCTACGAGCSHAGYTEVPYTCGQGGYVTEECDTCGKYRATTTAIPANHNYVDGKCTNCNADEPAAPCEHVWSDPNGADAGKCTKCNASCEHTDGTTLSYGDCITSDYDTERCNVCQKALNHVSHDRGRHTYGDNGKCTVCNADQPAEDCVHEWEWSTGKCKKCGEECPHEDMEILHPDCTEGGYIRHRCTLCGWITVENTPAEPGEHKYKITSTATCTKEGIETAICEVCGDRVETKVPALGHDYKNGVCTRCGHSIASKVSGGEYDDVPKTGDIRIVPMAALLVLMGTAACIFIRKRTA